MKIKGALLLLLLLVSAAKVSYGQVEYPEDKVSWKFTVEQDGEDAYIVGTITMVEHWHIYAANLPEGAFSIPTEISIKPNKNYKAIGGIREPKPIFEHVAGEDLYYHSNTVVMKRKIKVLSEKDFTIDGTFGFQTCDDDHCLQPFTTDFSVKVKGFEPKEETLEDLFENAKGDEVKDDEGNLFVKVNDKWHQVPEGNSSEFYKKYIELAEKDEK
ncbi:protein-disulfide reductase DsbD family protein [Crocinitomicaceae bacterium]|nr:protein-disulfide reductase DsbD family protein [Crocinitomicaceae bacterium]